MLIPCSALLAWLLCYAKMAASDVNMEGLRFVNEPPYHMEFSNNTGAKISCSISGNPTPTVFWTLADGNRVRNIPSLRQVTTDGTLTFPPFKAEDYRQDVHAVVYRCMASNSLGAIISRDVQVQAVMSQSYEPQVYDAFPLKGNTAVLKCHLPPFIGSHVVVISWMKDNVIKIDAASKEDEKFAMSSADELFVLDVGPNDVGSSFRCQTTDKLTGENQLSSMAGKLFISDPKSKVSPRIVDGTTSISVRVGEIAILPCVSQGFPNPSVSWYIKSSSGQLLSLGDQYLKTKVSLIIPKIRIADAGSYVCMAENTVGSEKKEINVTVTAPLRVKITPHYSKLTGDSPAVLQCVVSGSPVLSYGWMKNGQAYPTKEGQTSISVQQNGMYQCFARNNKEMVHDAALVSAGDVAPEISSSFDSQAVHPGESVSVECSATGNPLPTATWLLDGYPLPNSVKFTTSEKAEEYDNIISTLSIKHIKNEDGGNYICVFTNKIGKSEFAGRVNVFGNPGIKTMAKASAVAGQPFAIICPYYGYPIKNVKWYKDGQELPTDLRHFVHKNGTLQIQSTQRIMDDGKYTCAVTSTSEATARQTVEVVVMIAPKIIPFSFQDKYVTEGRQTRVLCGLVEGDGPVKMGWLKNSRPINARDEDISIQIVDDFSSILSIANVRREHTGNYTCVAENHAASSRFTADLVVNAAPKIIPFSFQDTHLYEGVLAQVSCVVYQGDVPITLSWAKDGHNILPIKGITIRDIDEFSSVLTIESVRQDHSGNYTCTARNAAASVTSVASLVVNVPPKWVMEPKDTSVVTGNEIALECKVDGYPIPTTTWTKVEGESKELRIPIVNNKKFHVERDGTLNIITSDKELEGFYFCKAENGIGVIGKMVYLTVHSPPILETKSQDLVTRRGETLSLVCRARGDTPIHFTWRIRGEVVPDSKTSRHEIKNYAQKNVSYSEFVRFKSDKQDSTTFQCTAKNEYGTDEALFHVTVEDVPDKVREVKLVESSNRTVIVSWVSRNDNGSPVLRYVVQYKHIKDGWKEHHLNVTVDGQARTAKISGLKPAENYNIRVIAENEIGLSEHSKDVEISVPEDAPSAPPQDISVMATDTHTLKVSWKPPRKDHWNGIIRGYYIGYKVVDSTEPYVFRLLEVPEDYSEGLSLTVNSLLKFTQYSIVVQAFNDGGKGPMSKEVVVITSESVPTKPPSEVRCSVLSSQSIHVTWQPPPSLPIHGVIRGYRVIYKPVDVEDDGQIGRSHVTVKSTTVTKLTLQGLGKYTNYSIQILAHNKKGDGVKSDPIFCKTLEDVPDAPSDIKVLAASKESVVLAWQLPKHPNGAILKYSLYVKDAKENVNKHVARGNSTFNEITGLKSGEKYEFWVTASTIVGEGKQSRTVTQSLGKDIVPAKVVAFDTTIFTPADKDIKLICPAVGMPEPKKKWISNGSPVVTGERLSVLSDGSLLIKDVHPEDSDDYSCHIENERGDDHVTYSIVVQTVPESVTMDISLTTPSSIDILWRPKGNGGSAILGFKLFYKHDLAPWETILLDPLMESYRLDGLSCGSKYQIYAIAFNKMGDGKFANIVTTSTKGGVPIIPIKDLLIEEGTTFITLHLQEWQIDSCLIKYFIVEYKKLADTSWRLFSDDLKADKNKIVLSGLHLATWYNLRIIAHTSSGTSTGEYVFGTLTHDGVTLQPDTVADAIPPNPLSFLTDLRFILSGAAALTLLLAATVLLLCFCSRRKKNKKSHHHHRHGSRDRDHHRKSEHHGEKSSDSTLDGKKKRKSKSSSGKSSELTPYATAHLSDFHGKHARHSVPASKSVYPQISRPGSSLGNASMSTSELLNIRSQMQQIPTAPPMSDAYGANPAAFYSHVLKERQLPATPRRSNPKIITTPLPPLPVPDVITQRHVHAGDNLADILENTSNGDTERMNNVQPPSTGDTKYDAPWDVKGPSTNS